MEDPADIDLDRLSELTIRERAASLDRIVADLEQQRDEAQQPSAQSPGNSEAPPRSTG